MEPINGRRKVIKMANFLEIKTDYYRIVVRFRGNKKIQTDGAMVTMIIHNNKSRQRLLFLFMKIHHLNNNRTNESHKNAQLSLLFICFHW